MSYSYEERDNSQIYNLELELEEAKAEIRSLNRAIAQLEDELNWYANQ